jgi:hypothetical protein
LNSTNNNGLLKNLEFACYRHSRESGNPVISINYESLINSGMIGIMVLTKASPIPANIKGTAAFVDQLICL